MADQFAALPWRVGADGVEVMLITSRDTGRWIIPKGKPMRGHLPHEAAAVEAWEEAGLTGAIGRRSLGRFRYLKRSPKRERWLSVAVFPLAVATQAEDWPERHQRSTRWFTVADAAAAVAEPELRALIAGFTPPGRPEPWWRRVLRLLR